MKDFQALQSYITVVFAAVITLTVSACSTPKWVDSTLNKLPESIRQDGQTGQTDQTGQVYYVITSGLPVYSTASASSKVLGHLDRYEKVTRTRLEKGYAYVTSKNGSLKGWVENSRLDWRVPPKETPTKAPADEAASSPARSESSQPESAPENLSPPDQIPSVIAPPESPVPERSEIASEPVAETLPTPQAPVNIPEPVEKAPPVPMKPAPTGNGSKPAPSIFDSF
ncbi:MAG: hypothetical protein J0652_10350 [Desulfobulbaceae bacterium]|nr:hypothetical protein [Desulfobulbaceae bacterium]